MVVRSNKHLEGNSNARKTRVLLLSWERFDGSVGLGNQRGTLSNVFITLNSFCLQRNSQVCVGGTQIH